MYRLDPLKIPEEGVRARCMLCPGIFFVGRCGDEAADPDRVVAPADGGRDGDGGPASDFEGSAARAAEPARVPADTGASDGDLDRARGFQRSAGHAAEPARAPAHHAVALASGPADADGAKDGDGGPATDFGGSAARAAEPARAPGPRDQHLPPAPFGARDPHERAYGLARALVSDIVAYHRERRDRSLRSGTVRREFRAEIHQKWDEYVAQVGNEMARGTSYFRDALNELLAGGVRLF